MDRGKRTKKLRTQQSSCAEFSYLTTSFQQQAPVLGFFLYSLHHIFVQIWYIQCSQLGTIYLIKKLELLEITFTSSKLRSTGTEQGYIASDLVTEVASFTKVQKCHKRHPNSLCVVPIGVHRAMKRLRRSDFYTL